MGERYSIGGVYIQSWCKRCRGAKPKFVSLHPSLTVTPPASINDRIDLSPGAIKHALIYKTNGARETVLPIYTKVYPQDKQSRGVKRMLERLRKKLGNQLVETK